MRKHNDRELVINNIKNAVQKGKFNQKVEIGDHVVTLEDRINVVMKFDTLRETRIYKTKRMAALSLANEFTKLYNKNTVIEGIENINPLLDKGAIITANHFNPADSTVIRHLTNKLKRTNKLDIVIEEANIFMTEDFGLLMNYCNTIPVSKHKEYLKEKFYPAIEQFFEDKHWILIFPEEEMWFNYRKPRPLKDGAYHLACKYNVPIIPTFIAMYEREGEFDKDGFNKINYKLFIGNPIYPDMSKPPIERKKEIKDKDYKFKVKKYEEAYGKKLDYKFDYTDIAGYSEDRIEEVI